MVSIATRSDHFWDVVECKIGIMVVQKASLTLDSIKNHQKLGKETM